MSSDKGRELENIPVTKKRSSGAPTPLHNLEAFTVKSLGLAQKDLLLLLQNPGELTFSINV